MTTVDERAAKGAALLDERLPGWRGMVRPEKPATCSGNCSATTRAAWPRSGSLAGLPDPKSRSLTRGERRYRRKVASPKQWQAIIAAKGATCRLEHAPPVMPYFVQYHHVVPRDAPYFGDDVADNIVPLCDADHDLVTAGHKLALYRLAESLTEAEYAYVVGKLGESGPARLFGVGR